MANITGFNPSEANRQIDDFCIAAIDLGTKFHIASTAFYTGLVHAWSSPKAEEFGKAYLPKLFSISFKVENMANDIGDRATLAYNDNARANGLPEIDTTGIGQFLDEPEGNYILYPAFDDGAVGMDHENVKELVGDLEDGRNKLVAGLSELPLDIAFYDPDGSQKAAYKAIINNMIETINGIVDEVTNQIKTALETEIEVVVEASTNAADELKGNFKAI